MDAIRDEVPAFFHRYVDLVPETDLLTALEAQLDLLKGLPAIVPVARETHAYAPGKWSIRQVAGHLGDGERVFGFRAFTFARGDTNPLPGFDENAYVAASGSHAIPLAGLVAELVALREANLSMLRGLEPASWGNRGTANGNEVSVRGLAAVMVGHTRHHLRVLRERYGIELPPA